MNELSKPIFIACILSNRLLSLGTNGCKIVASGTAWATLMINNCYTRNYLSNQVSIYRGTNSY
jgi:hypothetical protein